MTTRAGRQWLSSGHEIIIVAAIGLYLVKDFAALFPLYYIRFHNFSEIQNIAYVLYKNFIVSHGKKEIILSCKYVVGMPLIFVLSKIFRLLELHHRLHFT